MSDYNIHFGLAGGVRKVASILSEVLDSDFQEIDLCKEREPMHQ